MLKVAFIICETSIFWLHFAILLLKIGSMAAEGFRKFKSYFHSKKFMKSPFQQHLFFSESLKFDNHSTYFWYQQLSTSCRKFYILFCIDARIFQRSQITGKRQRNHYQLILRRYFAALMAAKRIDPTPACLLRILVVWFDRK